MADTPTTTTTTPAGEGSPTGGDTSKDTPPWGDSENFDAEKAWKLIENLRGELTEVKQARDDAREKLAATETDLTKVRGDSEQAAKTLRELQAQVATETAGREKDRMLHAAGLDPNTYSQFVVGNDKGMWQSAIDALLALKDNGGTPQVGGPDPAQAAAPDIDSRELLARQIFGD